MGDNINVGKRILKTLNNNGFEAYFVGEAVRNFILKKQVTRVDITTNANISSLKKLFMNYTFEDINEYSTIISFEDKKFYINSFVTNIHDDYKINYNKHYSKNLLDDLSRRDFTINAIAMSHSGKITDPFNGYGDIQKKKIKHIGKAKVKFCKDPSLIIKAFSLMSELNYNFSRKTKKEINKRRKYLCEHVIKTRIEDFKQIFENPYSKKAIVMMNKTNIDMVLPTFKKALRLLCNRYKKVDFQDVLMMSFILNGKIEKSLASLIEDHSKFMAVYDIAMSNKKSNFDEITLFKYGLDNCLIANRINNALGYSRIKTKKITKKWNTLKVKNPDDLLYGSIDIKKIIRAKDYYIIDDILNEVCVSIILGEITNSELEIQKMVLSLLNKNSIVYSFNGFNEGVMTEAEIKTNIDSQQQVDLDTINKHLMKQQERNIKYYEENEVLKKEDAVSINLDFLYENEEIKNKIKDIKDFEGKLQKIISGYMNSEDEGGIDEED